MLTNKTLCVMVYLMARNVKKGDKKLKPIIHNITQKDISQYDKLNYMLIRKFFPMGALYEASMDMEDLINQCRYETFRALVKFDPEKVMTSSIKDPVKNEARMKWKRANPEKAIVHAKLMMVYGRVFNYLRRVRWNHSVAVKGGTTVLFDTSSYLLPDECDSYTEEN